MDGEENSLNRGQFQRSFKQLALIGHHTKTFCLQHFNRRYGVIMDNFIQLHNCRRVVEFTDSFRIPERESLLAALDELVKGDKLADHLVLALGMEAATEENRQVDESIKKRVLVSDINHLLPNQKVEKFKMLNGYPYRHPGVP